MEMANGSRCESCTDVALPKRGLDPAKGYQSPIKQGQEEATKAGLTVQPLGVNQPLATGVRGRVLNIVI
ncbi:hypothetical protein CHU95_10005 [Niveispirillum lacus]|uniref:Uncharacterized protein n=1 Tax=Niveispirillum lacus TaxID=1981099 RepID=A0A255Z1V2_9PROT|nr:hypothetical protein [Niveispirillum lacus]OYQ34904.1 hypothetical protein CHU95_10005 [Niveispirillum lacus]